MNAIRSRRIVTPRGEVDGAVLIEDGRIKAVVSEAPTSAFDVGDLVVLPGFVDPHVHINEPGRADWEGFETATRAAAAGGITTLVDMPLNSLPVTTNAEALADKRRAAEGKLSVDVGFHGGVVPGNLNELPGLLDGGVLGVKAFLVDSGIAEFPPVGRAELEPAMRLLAGRGVPLLAHAEVQDTSGSAPGTTARTHAAARPPEWETRAVQLLIDLCRETGCRVHVVHVAAAECLPLLQAARAEGLPITAETCPHYLYFDLDSIPEADPLFKCAPPIRERANAEALLQGLRSGVLDFVASDHSPSPLAMKRGGFATAWGGISSLALGASVLTTLGARPRELATWLAAAPARLVGLQDRGAIAPGNRADLVVFDPQAGRVIVPEDLHTRHAISPYVGRPLRGVPKMTFLGGELIYDNGRFAPPLRGRLLHA